MEDIDKNEDSKINAENHDHDEEELFLKEAIQGDHNLLYLDTYLRELLA